MSSRVAIQQFVSAYEPTGVQIGDEWYNSSTDRLYKRTITSKGVNWIELLVGTGSRAGSIITTLTAKALANTALALPNNQTYALTDTRQYLDVFLDGSKLVNGIDYAEASTTTIIPLISIPIGSTIEYRTVT